MEIAEPTDEALVAATLAGDDAAFAELARRHKRKVFGMAARFARNRQDLEDLAQTVFLRVWRSLGGFRADAPFEHWLARLAIRCCHDFLRAAKHRPPEVPLDEADSVTAPDDPCHAREIIAAALARLKPDERLVLTLLELENHSVREISQATGWSEANVKVRAHRARAALKHILESHHE